MTDLPYLDIAPSAAGQAAEYSLHGLTKQDTLLVIELLQTKVWDLDKKPDSCKHISMPYQARIRELAKKFDMQLRVHENLYRENTNHLPTGERKF